MALHVSSRTSASASQAHTRSVHGSQSSASSSSSSVGSGHHYHASYQPKSISRFQLAFPSIFDRCFAPFDNPILSLCQKHTTGLVLLFSTTFTFFTSIEISLVFPPTLYALGYDRAAGLSTSLLLVLGVVSQIPKKFIFRARPWMVQRAKAIRRDKTSSFPSRAVVCAVVFSWLIAWGAASEGLIHNPVNSIALWVGIACVATLTAFARINVGAHYPSDTVLGFVLGCLVIRLGTRLELFWTAVCNNPQAAYMVAAERSTTLGQQGAAYMTMEPSLTNATYMLNLLASRPFMILTTASYMVTLISIRGFWVKCSYVYGLLLCCATFRATFLCNAGMSRGVSEIVQHGPMATHLKAVIPFLVLLLFGMATRGRKGLFRIVSFSVIYICSFVVLLTWRLRSQADF